MTAPGHVAVSDSGSWLDLLISKPPFLTIMLSFPLGLLSSNLFCLSMHVLMSLKRERYDQTLRTLAT